MPFLPPNQQRQSTEGTVGHINSVWIHMALRHPVVIFSSGLLHWLLLARCNALVCGSSVCVFCAHGQPTATGVLLSVDQLLGTVYLWHCNQVTSRRRLSEDIWRHFCWTFLTVSYIDSYSDIDSYVTLLPSLPTYRRSAFVAFANLRCVNVLDNNNDDDDVFSKNSTQFIVKETQQGVARSQCM